MHYTLFASLFSGLVTLGGNHYHRCLLVDPLPPATAHFSHPAAGQHQQLDQLGESPAQRRRGHRIQCGYQSLPLFV